MDPRQALYSILAARWGLPAGLSQEELFSRLAEIRPELALLREHLTRSQDAPAGSPEDDDLGFDEQLEPVESDLTPVVEALRSVLETLAHALGACAACWGRDPACGECSGRGGPGWCSPDLGLFDELILPAVRRRQADLRASDRPRPPRQRRPPQGNGHHPDVRN